MKNISVTTIILAVIALVVAFLVFTNFAKIKKFISEVIVELKKVSWSTKKELMDATKVVIVSSLFLGLYIAGTDFILSKLVGLIIR